MRDVSRINTPKESVDFTGYWFILACCVRAFGCSGCRTVGLSAVLRSSQYAIRILCGEECSRPCRPNYLFISFGTIGVRMRCSSALHLVSSFEKTFRKFNSRSSERMQIVCTKWRAKSENVDNGFTTTTNSNSSQVIFFVVVSCWVNWFLATACSIQWQIVVAPIA